MLLANKNVYNNDVKKKKIAKSRYIFWVTFVRLSQHYYITHSIRTSYLKQIVNK